MVTGCLFVKPIKKPISVDPFWEPIALCRTSLQLNSRPIRTRFPMKTTTPVLFRAGLLAFTPLALNAQDLVTLEQLTVTAQKRVQSISDVPVPITAYTGSFLDRA